MTTEEAILGIIPGPIWPNGCSHGGYVVSFTSWNGTVEERIDLYVFQPNEASIYPGQSVCMRFGEDGGDYYSPGNVQNLISGARAGMESYRHALEILESRGQIVWQPEDRPPPTEGAV